VYFIHFDLKDMYENLDQFNSALGQQYVDIEKLYNSRYSENKKEGAREISNFLSKIGRLGHIVRSLEEDLKIIKPFKELKHYPD